MASSSTARPNQTPRENAFDQIAPCSAPKSAKPWDIFINHRGPDVKQTLAANIHHKLHSLGFNVFLDVEALEAGDSIPAEIQHAIASATLHIAIFSPNYAQSPWCLAELSFMLETDNKIIPIFYHVDPSDLRYIDQGKGKYAHAFSEHEKKGRYTPGKLGDWKRALHNSSFLSGYLVNNNEDEATVLKNIVNDALKIMKKDPLWVAEHPLGLDELVKEFESAAGEETVNIRGIVGMGGSGKTTLAKELFNWKSSFFVKCSFVFDVRDAASRDALPDKQKKLLADLGAHHSSFDHVDEGKVVLANYLSSHRAFIVLDDVDHIEQLNALLPNKDNLRSHSLVIVTTRELGVLISWGLPLSCIYRMPGLKWLHARQLFCWHAFLQPSPPAEFETLVEEFLKACNGLPLSLKVLGAQLYGRKSKDYWKSQLHKILRILPGEIQQRLKVSYDALDEEEKEMFLDIACFSIVEEKSTAIAVWDGSGWSGLHGLETLVNKCLVEVVEEEACTRTWSERINRIRMHDHLRDMGREIASRQSPYRLWCPQQIDNMKHSTERKPIRGIQPADSYVAFKKYMHELMPGYYFPNSRDHCSRIYQSHEGSSSTSTNCFGRCLGKRTGRYKYEEPKQGNSIRRSERPQFSNGLQILSVRGNELTEEFATLSEDLVMLFWKDFPLRNVPSWLTLKNLRVLELDGADELEELWQNNADPPLQLSELILRNCRKLQWFPSSIRRLHHLKRLVADFPGSGLTVDCWGLQSLENLRLCSPVISSLPDDFGNFTSLRNINLQYCTALNMLPASFSQLIHLTDLDLSCCEMLSSLPDYFGNLTSLRNIDLCCCKGFNMLPASFSQLIHLIHLDLSDCEMLASLPDDFGNLTSLRNINLYHCKELNMLPASFSQLIHLTDLNLSDCEMLSSLPDDFGNLTSLRNINLQHCNGLNMLPASFSQLIHLTDLNLSGCEMLSSLPDDFGNLTSLRNIYLYYCKRLNMLPASFSQLKHLTDLDLANCEMLSSLPDDFGNLTSLRNINLYYCKGLNMLPASFSQLIHLTDLNLSYCEMLSSLPETLPIMSLNNLTIIFCNFLKDVRCISGLINLETLEIYDCLQIEELPSFADLPSLKRFEMRNCPKVEKIEGLEHAKSLKKLCVETFWEVPGIQGLENVERLEVLHLKCETISALKPCIQSIKGKECPRRMWIQGSVNHLKESIVNSLELEFSDLEKVIRVPDDSNDSEVSNVWEVDDEDDDEDDVEDDDGDDDENDDEDEVEDDDDFSNEGDYYYLYYAEKEKEKSKVVRIWYSVCAPDDHYRLPNRLIVVSGKKQRVAEAFHQLLNLLE